MSSQIEARATCNGAGNLAVYEFNKASVGRLKSVNEYVTAMSLS